MLLKLITDPTKYGSARVQWLFVICVALVCGACSDTEMSGVTADEALQARMRFTPVAEDAGLGNFRHVNSEVGDYWIPSIMGAGGGFIDYDGDGWIDILLVGGGSLPGQDSAEIPAVVLYRNNGDGTFSDRTRDAGLSGVHAYGFGIAAADYDNDGDTDFLLTTLTENVLFRNVGGHFEEAGAEVGLADEALWSTSAMFFDADRDGDLDLYVANYLNWSPEINIECADDGQRDYCNPRVYDGVPDTYYENNGDGTFTNRTTEAGFHLGTVPDLSKGLGVSELDYNGDGWTDVYVANDGAPNFLFTNNGDGTFTETAGRSGVAMDRNGTPRAGMGVDVGVVDSTGEPTIFVGNFSEESIGVWRHDKDGLFTDRDAASGIGFPSRRFVTFGLVLFDADLDTDLDMLTVNGHVMKFASRYRVGIRFEQPSQFFLNQGDGEFEEVTWSEGPLAEPMLGRGLAYADVDRDGDLDVLATENGGPVHLWQNELREQTSAESNFLRVRLEGLASNRDALGARVRATVDGFDMERRVKSGSSYLSQSEKTVTFGLGSRREVDVLEVAWPSGRVDRFEQIPPNVEAVLVEGDEELLTQPLPARPTASR